MIFKNRISITGPESTGKSILSEKLANYFSTDFVPEYSREYLSAKPNYNFDDVLEIAKGQLLNEDNKAEENALLFCDTDVLVNKIWCDFAFGKCHEFIETKFINHRYGLYILCYPDIEWEFDPLRENPDNRLELFDMYKNELDNSGANYRILCGKGEQRLKNAISFVKEYLDDNGK